VAGEGRHQHTQRSVLAGRNEKDAPGARIEAKMLNLTGNVIKNAKKNLKSFHFSSTKFFWYNTKMFTERNFYQSDLDPNLGIWQIQIKALLNPAPGRGFIKRKKLRTYKVNLIKK
jgi:hypothetical protein